MPTQGGPPTDKAVMIIGAMKCGTTSLYRQLAQHPQVCAARAKETEYFSQWQGHRSAVASYADLFDFDPRRHRVTLEASTGYTKFPQEQGVAERIQAAGLRPWLVYLLRDPLERIASHIRHVAEHADATAGWPFAAEYLLHLSMYHRQLAPFARCFGRDRLLLLDFDEYVRDPLQTLRHLERWVGLSPHDAYDLRPAHRSGQPALAAGWRGRLQRLRRGLRQRAQSHPRHALEAHERAFIRNALAADMAALQRDYGVAVERWGFGEDAVSAA